LSDEKSGTVLFSEALKTGFVENKEQSGPLSVDSKTQGKCQLSVKFSDICQLSVKILAICQLSVSPIQTLLRARFVPKVYHSASLFPLKWRIYRA